jgi:acetoin utilization deacetylase AcuC-like enzyme
MTATEETADRRVVSILEGGYSLEGLAGGTAAHVRALMGRQGLRSIAYCSRLSTLDNALVN